MDKPARYVSLQYQGGPANVPHLADVFRLKGHTFGKGETVEVPDHIAGMAIRSAPAGSMKVIAGEPVDVPPVPGSVREARRLAAEFDRTFHKDPAKLLETIAALPADVLRLVRGVKEAEAVAALDKIPAEHLPMVALWARLNRFEVLAKAAARAHVKPTP